MVSEFEKAREMFEAEQAAYSQAGITEKNIITPRFYDNNGVTSYTLGSFLTNLKLYPEDAVVKIGLNQNCNLHLDSWRGDYQELTLGRSNPNEVTVADVIASLEWQVGKIIQGHKGGFYRITENAPLWAERESSGCSYEYLAGIRLEPDGVVTLLTAITDDY